MLQAHTGNPRKGGSHPLVSISRSVLGTLDATKFHDVLRVVAANNPEELDKNLQKGDIQKILRAYGASVSTSRRKESLLAELIGAIAGHDKFELADDSLFLPSPGIYPPVTNYK